jgi:hypothetical protein
MLDGQFQARLMLLDDLWDSIFAPHTPNGAIMALPTRDVLAFCDAKSLQGVIELNQLVERMQVNAEHPLTNTLYHRQDRQWLPLN